MKLSPSSNDGTDLADVHYRRYSALSTPVKGTVLYFHGNKGNMHKCESQIEIFLKNQYDVWTMDYREFGDSTGELSEKALLGDAKRVYDEMISSGVKESDVVIWGRSFGSGVAASVVAAGATPKIFVLETPYWSLPEAARSGYLLLPDFLFHYQLPTHQYLSKANSECRIELIHGTYDEKIPFSSSERLYLRCRELKLSVKCHPIACGRHDLRPDPDFKAIVQRILE
jgi:alpha-beta hydrolase superfamily lysophospholipase